MGKFLQKYISIINLSKILAALAVLAALYLNYIGFLQPVISYLDRPELTFKAGKIEISAYDLLIGIFALIVTFWVAGILTNFGQARIVNIQNMNISNRLLLSKFYQILVYGIAFFIALSVAGIDFGVLAVFGGALGIGIGFGLQKITSNFISGLILLLEKSITTGDLIELEDGTIGFLKVIRGRFSLIETFDGKEKMIPNEDFMTSHVTSWTFSNEKGRVEIKVGVSYDTDLDHAQKIMLDAALGHPRTSKEIEPKAFVTEFADSSVNLLLHFWVDDIKDGRMGPKSDVMKTIYKQFKAEGIEIPFPQRDVNFKEQKLKEQKTTAE